MSYTFSLKKNLVAGTTVWSLFDLSNEFKLQPWAEVVGKVSLLTLYRLFHSGVTEECRKKKILDAAHRQIPHLLFNVEHSTDTKPNIAEWGGEGGEGKVKRANLPNSSVCGCSLN